MQPGDGQMLCLVHERQCRDDGGIGGAALGLLEAALAGGSREEGVAVGVCEREERVVVGGVDVQDVVQPRCGRRAGDQRRAHGGGDQIREARRRGQRRPRQEGRHVRHFGHEIRIGEIKIENYFPSLMHCQHDSL